MHAPNTPSFFRLAAHTGGPAYDLPAMNREPSFACRSRMTDCLCRCAHEPRIERSEKMRQVDSGDRQCSSKTAVIRAVCWGKRWGKRQLLDANYSVNNSLASRLDRCSGSQPKQHVR